MNEAAKRIIEAKLNCLSKSKFRSSFSLRKRERDYIEKHGMEKIREPLPLVLLIDTMDEP